MVTAAVVCHDIFVTHYRWLFLVVKICCELPFLYVFISSTNPNNSFTTLVTLKFCCPLLFFCAIIDTFSCVLSLLSTWQLFPTLASHCVILISSLLPLISFCIVLSFFLAAPPHPCHPLCNINLQPIALSFFLYCPFFLRGSSSPPLPPCLILHN